MQNFSKQLSFPLDYYKKRFNLRIIFEILFALLSPALLTSAAILLRLLLQQDLSATPFQLLTLVVFIHALLGKRVASIVAILLTTFVAHYILMEPSWSFKFTDSDSTIRTLIYLIQCSVITYFTLAFHQKSKELKQLSNSLEVTREKFRYASQKVFTLFLITSTDGTILEANKAYLELFKNSPQELIGQKIHEVAPWATHKSTQEKLQTSIESLTTKKSILYEDLFPISPDKVIDVEVNLTLIEGKGKNSFVIVSAIDITNRKLTERIAEREHLVYSHLLNSDVIGIVFTTSDRKITSANKRFLNLIGHSLTDIIKNELSLISLVPDVYHPHKAKVIRKILKKGYGGPVEIEIASKEGALVPVLFSGVIFDPIKEILMFLIVDLTEQKKLERKKDEFISIASHEIKTPLTIIKGYLQLINQKVLVNDYSKFPQFVSVLDHEIDKLTTLLNEMLDLSKIENHKLVLRKEEIDLVKLTKEITKGIKPVAGSRKIVFHSTADSLLIQADASRLNQVILNLLTNALKHSPSKGTINVRIIPGKKHVRVEIQDFGQGIHPEKMKQIFGKFFQIDKTGQKLEGLGLGLYIAKEIVERHNGKIGVESTYGEGTTFYFTLPRN